MITLAASYGFGLQKTFSPIVAAEASTEPDTTQEESLIAPEPEALQLAAGTPQSTTPSDVMPRNAIIRWTPTGLNEVQDTYDVLVSSQNNPSDNGTLPDPLIESDDLTSAELDIRSLPQGNYYWQVRSCDPLAMCSDWSQIWSINIDAVNPSAPTATVTSDSYSTTVKFGGTGEPLSRVVIVVDGNTCTTQPNGEGDWICVFSSDFDFGDYTAIVKAVDKAGNESSDTILDFSVNELFVAETITDGELPVTLDVIPVDESPQNKVTLTPVTSVIDVDSKSNEEIGDVAGATAPLSVEGGIVQSSQSGWQVLGLPWFVWMGSVAALTSGWMIFGGVGSRRIGSLLSI